MYSVAVNNSSLTGLNTHSREEEACLCYWKPSQLSKFSESTNCWVESSTTILLNQHNRWLHSKYVSFHSQINVVLNPHQGNFSFQQSIFTEKHHASKFRIREPSLSDHTYKTTPVFKTWGILEKVWVKKSQRVREFAMKLCLLVMLKAMPIKSHQQ